MKNNTVLTLLRQAEKLKEIKSIVLVITSAMVLPLYFLFWFCDLVYAPTLKWEFLGLRATVIPLALVVHYFIKRASTLTAAYRAAFSYTALIGLPISIMVLLLGDPATPYYAGLNLVAIGMLTFIPWTNRLFFAAAIAIFAPYYIFALHLSRTTVDYDAMVVTSFFIIGTVAISWVVRMFYERMRVRELQLRLDMNQEIERRKQMEITVIQARDDALAANKTKSGFLATMSHELRTPLNAIIGYSELLQEEALDDGLNSCVDDLQKIEESGKHLLSLVNNVLDLSKVEAGRMELHVEKFAVNELMQSIATIAQPLADKNHNKLQIQSTVSDKIRTDQTKLKQVLLNLISNSCKFTHNGLVNVSVAELCVSTKRWLCFDVMDTGIGMTPAQCNKVFQAFVQAESGTSKQYGGTGLGLSISQQFCRLMGGDITVNSAPGRGTVFSVKIPRDILQDSINFDASRNFSERRSTRSKIVLLHGEMDCRNAVQVELIQHGFEVSATGVDNASVEFARGLSPDVMLYDVNSASEIIQRWEVGDSEPCLQARPSVLISMRPKQRNGFAFGFSALMRLTSFAERVAEDPIFDRLAENPGNILLAGIASKVVIEKLEMKHWQVSQVSEIPELMDSVQKGGFDVVVFNLALSQHDANDITLAVLQQLNQCSAKILLLAPDAERMLYAAQLFDWVADGMSAIALDEQVLSELVITQVKKYLRGKNLVTDGERQVHVA